VKPGGETHALYSRRRRPLLQNTSAPHFIRVAELVLDASSPGFSRDVMPLASLDALYRETYLGVHQRWLDSQKLIEDISR
jgi:hypothetical protein